MNTKFSVLLSIYFKENPLYFEQALKSIFNQTILPADIVIVKDGEITSNLNNVLDKFIKQYPEIINIVELKNNVGLGLALNEGLTHCKYDLVARMDSDDICKPNRFEKQLQIFESHPEINIVGSWLDEFIDNTSNVISVRKLPEFHKSLATFAKSRNPMNHPTVMFRKLAVIESGSYQHCYLMEDYFLWCRMLLKGYKFYNIQESLLFFRINKEMFKRRGGLKYALNEIKFQFTLYKVGFINIFTLLKNIAIRFTVRLMPNFLRKIIYSKTLR